MTNIRHARNIAKGRFGAYLNPTGVKKGTRAYVEHDDYSGRVIYDPATFPNGTILSTHAPDEPLPHEQVFWLAAFFIDSYGGAGKGVRDFKAQGPWRLSDLKALRVDFEWSWAYKRGLAHGLCEVFYTTGPGDTGANRKLESGFYTSADEATRRWQGVSGHKPLPDWTDPMGRTWQVKVAQPQSKVPFCMFFGEHDLTIGAVDFLAAAQFQKWHGLLDGSDFHNGIGFGYEAVSGSQAMQVERLAVSIA